MRQTKKKQDFNRPQKTTKAEQFFDENIFGENQTVGNYLWIVRFEGKKRLQNLKNDELKKKTSESQKQKSHIFVYFRGLGKKVSFLFLKSNLTPF